jgi:heat shock protein HslJ
VRFGIGWRWWLALGLAACAAPPGPQAVAVPSLAGTRWMGVIDPSIDPRFAPWIEFAEGRVSGYTGCNLMQGAWTNDRGGIRVGPLATTKRACAGPEQAIERRVVAALNEQSRVTREPGKLVFTTSTGERFEFIAAPR